MSPIIRTVPGMVSVITPVYNSDKFLSLTCDSVLAQTWGRLELILIDDASIDSSRAIMQSYAARDGRLKCLFMEKNGGPAQARNRGIEAASGEFIAFIDADDLWASRKVERQIAAFDGRPTLGLVGTNGAIFDSKGVRPELMIRSGKIRRGKVSLADFILKGVPLITSSVMVRKECLDRCGLFKESYAIGEDYELWMRIIQGFEIDILDEKLTFYRRHEGNISNNTCKSRCCKISIFENEILPNIGLLGNSSDEFLLKLQKMYTTAGKMLSRAKEKTQADVFLCKAIALRVSIPVTFRAWLYRAWNRFGREAWHEGE